MQSCREMWPCPNNDGMDDIYSTASPFDTQSLRTVLAVVINSSSGVLFNVYLFRDLD